MMDYSIKLCFCYSKHVISQSYHQVTKGVYRQLFTLYKNSRERRVEELLFYVVLHVGKTITSVYSLR